MAHATFDRPAHVQLPNMTRLDLTGSGSRDALLPLLPDATIDEIVAGVRTAGASQVELLVPNNTRVLQSLAGCELLKEAVAAAGLSVTLFTADEATIKAASRAELDVIAVGSSILPDKRPSTFRAKPLGQLERAPAPPVRSTPSEPLRQVANTPMVVTAPGFEEPEQSPVAPDDAFLQRLRAFEQSQSPPLVAPGETVETAEGSLLFDAPGDRGVPRSNQRVAWNAAFDDMDATMAAEPAPQPVRRRDVPVASTQSKQVPDRKAAALRWPFQKRTNSMRSAETAVRRLQGGTVRQPQLEAKGVASESSRLLWLVVALAAGAIGLIAWFGLGALGIGLGTQQITLTPPVPSSEMQTFTGLEVALANVPAAGAIQGRVLEQPVRVLIQGQAISSTLVPIGRATGSLVLRNRGSFAVTVRAGQIIQAANGTTFTVDNEVTVPAATERPDGSGTIYGQGVAELTATVPGAAGNIPAGTIGGIPGVEATVRVEQGEFSGGSDQEVRIVRTEDVNRVLPQAVSDLSGAAIRALTAAVGQDPALALASDTITPTNANLRTLTGIEVAVFPPIGSVTSDGTFQVELRGVFRGMAGPTGQPVAEQLTQVVRNQLVTEGRIGEDAQIDIVGWRSGGPGLLVDATIRPSGRVVALSDTFLSDVQQQIAGLPRVDAEAYLQTLVVDNKIAGFSTLPNTWETVPEKVEIKPEQQQ